MKLNRFFVCLVLALILLASPAFAVAPEEITLDMLIAANTNDHLLEKHTSIYLTGELDGEPLGEDYVDRTMCYTDSIDTSRLYFDGQICEKIDDLYRLYLYADYEADIEWTKSLFPHPESEELIEAAREGDMLIVKTCVAKESSDGDEGGYLEFTYTLNADDLSIRSLICNNFDADGSIIAGIAVNVEFDVPAPEGALDLQKHINPQENYRTVTFITDPGTENEAVYTTKSVKGDPVSLVTRQEYSTLYTDPECTQVYVSANVYTEDLTLYANGK